MAAAAPCGEPPGGAVVRAFDETAGPAAAHDRIDTERWAGLAAAVLREEGVARGELGLRFVGQGAMAELNLAHMGAPGPTDVLAFPIDGDNSRAPEPTDVHAIATDSDNNRAPEPTDVHAIATDSDNNRAPRPEPAVLLGDVVVCPAYAALAAGDGRLADELALLVVHGVLHVLGYDHAHDREAAAMQARERQLLAAHHRKRPSGAGNDS